MLDILLIKSNPAIELSSSLPTKGDTYLAPAFAANIACASSNINVTLTAINCLDNSLHTARPSGVQGTLIVACLPNFLESLIPSS